MNISHRLIEEITNEIKSLEAELARAKDAERYVKELTQEQQLAIVLHAKYCHGDHTKSCGWFYGVKKDRHDWTEHAHAKYQKQAAIAIDAFKINGVKDFDTIISIVRLM